MGVDNSVALTGRLTKDPELKMTANNIAFLSFTLAVQRGYDKEKADFLSCIAWRKSAEFLAKYGQKGNMVSVQGELQMDTYEGKNGTVYNTYVNVNDLKIRTKAKSNDTEDVEEPKAVKEEEPKKETTKKEATKKKTKQDDEFYETSKKLAEKEDLPF